MENVLTVKKITNYKMEYVFQCKYVIIVHNTDTLINIANGLIVIQLDVLKSVKDVKVDTILIAITTVWNYQEIVKKPINMDTVLDVRKAIK